MNDYFIDVVVEFGRSGMRACVGLPIRQIFLLDRNSLREVTPDGSVIYKLPGEWRGEMMDRKSVAEYCPA